jgi:hypothetical protein
MAPIDEALAEIELHKPGDGFTLKILQKNMVLIARHWGKGARARQARGAMGTRLSNYSTHNKSRHLYSILKTLQLVGYLLQEL